MGGYEREIQTALTAVAEARQHLERVDRSELDGGAKRQLTTIVNALTFHDELDYGVAGVYDATRKSLTRLTTLDRVVGRRQRSVVADAVAALYRAEDALRDAYWRG